MIRFAYLFPWLVCWMLFQFGFPGRSRGAEVFRVLPRLGAPGVLWTQTASGWFAKRNPFSPIRDPGGNHFVTASGEWVTVSDAGTVHLQSIRFPWAVVAGGNFLIDPASKRIRAVDAWGYPVEAPVEVKTWSALGWNWLVTGDGELITVRRSGVAPGDGSGMVIRKTGWDFSDIRFAGGTFLVRASGRVVTISEVTGFFREWDGPESGILWVGGNHLIDRDSRLWTVDEEGGFQNTRKQAAVLPVMNGKNWLRFPDGMVWGVDSKGQIAPPTAFYEPIDSKSVFKPRVSGGGQ